MIIALLLQFISAATVPIEGAVLFYPDDCPDFSKPLPRIYNLDVGKRIYPSDWQEIHSMQWAYPSSAFRLEFYKGESTKPYATIIGPEDTRYTGYLCGWTPMKSSVFQVQVEDGYDKIVFPSADSYVTFVSNQ